MTRVNRRIRARRPAQSDLTALQRLHLLHGLDLPPGAFESPEAGREAWERHAAALISEYIRERGLFRRPWAWWHYTAPEPRRCLADPEGMIISRGGFYFGMPGMFSRPPGPEAGPWFESTRAYLLRCGLPLTAEERRARRSAEEFPEGAYPGQEEQKNDRRKRGHEFA